MIEIINWTTYIAITLFSGLVIGSLMVNFASFVVSALSKEHREE